METQETCFDQVLEARPQLTWLPWVGSEFCIHPLRTMILGESTYNRAPGDEIVAERIAGRDHLRVVHRNHALTFDRKSKYVRNIERAIFAVRKPTVVQKQKLWMGAAYHNLVLRPMKTRKHRPTVNDYEVGWREALSLIELLEVHQCLVYGLESSKLSALREVCNGSKYVLAAQPRLEKVGRSTPRLYTLSIGSHVVKLLFVRHPSAYFSWKAWTQVIQTTLSFEQCG